MKRLLIAFLLFFPVVASASILGIQQGGTASSTLTGILMGNGIGSIRTLTIGSNLTLTGSTLSATGGGTGASSTLLIDSNTFTGTNIFATTTIGNLNGTIVVDGVHYAQTGTGIQQAINACSSLSSANLCNTVYLPAATYSITPNTLTLASNVNLTGAGEGTKLTSDTGGTNQKLILGTSLNNVTIANMFISGANITPLPQNTNGSLSRGIYINGGTNISIKDVRFEQFEYDLWLDKVSNSRLDHVTDFSGYNFNGNSNGSLDALNSHELSSTTITNFNVSCGDTCLRLASSHNLVISNNILYTSGIEINTEGGAGSSRDLLIQGNQFIDGDGVYMLTFDVNKIDYVGAGYFAGIHDVQIIDNYFKSGTTSQDIILAATSGSAPFTATSSIANIIISGNTFDNATPFGTVFPDSQIQMINSSQGTAYHWQIYGNNFASSTGNGVRAFHAVDSTIHDNMFWNWNGNNRTDQYSGAISLVGDGFGTSTNVQIYGNHFDGQNQPHTNAIYVGDPTYLSNPQIGFNFVSNASSTVTYQTSAPVYLFSTSTGPVAAQYFTTSDANSTSTFSDGINLSDGCFSVKGTCLSNLTLPLPLASGGTATTTFSNKGILYFDGSTLTQKSGFVFNSSGVAGFGMGLGTSSPDAMLTIQGTTGGNGPLLHVGDDHTNQGNQVLIENRWSGAGGYGLLVRRNPSSPQFIVDGTGFVGIDMSLPTYALDVTGKGHFTGLVDAANFVATSTSVASTFGSSIGIATTTPAAALGVQGNMFIAGNITSTSTLANIFPYASSTAISTGYASSTLWFGGGLLSTCASGNFLTWTAGQFGCSADQTSAGAAPFNFGTLTFSTTTAATTTSIWTQGVFFSSSTKQASQFPYASSTALTSGNLNITGGVQSLVVGTSTTVAAVNGPGGSSYDGPLFLCDSCGGPNFLQIGAYGINVFPGINTFYARGTSAAPTATQSGDQIYFMGARGFGSTVWDVGSKAAIQFVASQAHTDTANGTYITLETTPNNSTTRAERVRIDQSGFVGIATTSPGSALSVQGNMFIAGNITSTSTLASAFPYASSTMLSMTTASTTNLIVSSAGGSAGCATFSSNGTISNTGSACSGGAGGTGTATTSFAATYPVQLTTSASAITFSNAFGTTTSWGIANNSIIATGLTGIPYGAATSSVTCSGGQVTCANIFTTGSSATITSSAWPYTTGSTDFGTVIVSTSTALLNTGGLYASSTVRFGDAGNQNQFIWNGSLSIQENNVATSTGITIDWNTGNSHLIQTGTSAFKIGFNNASTSGMQQKIIVCNPGAAAGALTWIAPVKWASGGATPAQTTTANVCDVYSFIITQATSTSAATPIILGTAVSNFP